MSKDNEQQDPGKEILETLKVQIEHFKLANGEEHTQIRGTEDPLLALSLLNDALSVLTSELIKRDMEGGEKDKKRIITLDEANITFSKN
tara:strand:- start:2434 stop:2700 length:267 start_codon:yes stop_codon:yes gene_type:complete